MGSVSRPNYSSFRAVGSIHGGLETAATAGTPSFVLGWDSTAGGKIDLRFRQTLDGTTISDSTLVDRRPGAGDGQRDTLALDVDQ